MKLKIMIMALLLVSVGIGSAVNRLPATEFTGDIDFMDGYYARNAMEGIVNVMDYGVVADGITDSTTEMLAAIAAARAAGHNTVYIPGGEYNFSVVETQSNISIIGVPGQTIINNSAGPNSVFWITNATNVYIYGIEVQGHGIGARVVRIMDSDNITIERCVGKDLISTAFSTSSNIVSGSPPGSARANYDITYKDCKMYNSGSYSFFMFATERGLIDGCDVRDSQSTSIEFKACANSTIRDCTVRNSGYYSIHSGGMSTTLPTHNNQIINNRVIDHGIPGFDGKTLDFTSESSAIHTYKFDNSIISGNIIEGCQNRSMILYGNDSIVSGNIISDCYKGIQTLYGDGFLITGNLFDHINDSAILCYTSNTSIINNIFHDIDYDNSGYGYSIWVSDTYGLPTDVFIALNTFSPSQTWVNGYDIFIKSTLGNDSGASVFANGPCKMAYNGMTYTGATDIRNDVFDATW